MKCSQCIERGQKLSSFGALMQCVPESGIDSTALHLMGYSNPCN